MIKYKGKQQQILNDSKRKTNVKQTDIRNKKEFEKEIKRKYGGDKNEE